MRKINDLTGRKFNYLTVIRYIGKNKYGAAAWECRCDCGVIKSITSSSLISNGTKSCGCKRFIHNDGNKYGLTHGGTNTKEYRAYMQMKARCYKIDGKDYSRYGARGITVCKRWLESFENFLEDMGKAPSIKYSLDRFPNNKNGNYELSNCRWATRKQQNINRRPSIFMTHKGETLVVAHWAKKLSISVAGFRYMLKSKTIPEIIKYKKIPVIDYAFGYIN